MRQKDDGAAEMDWAYAPCDFEINPNFISKLTGAKAGYGATKKILQVQRKDYKIQAAGSVKKTN